MNLLVTSAATRKRIASTPYPFKDNVYNDELYLYLFPILNGPFEKSFPTSQIHEAKGKQRWLTGDVLTMMQKNNNWPTITFDGLSPSASRFAARYLVNHEVRILNIYFKNRFDGHPGVTAINTQPIWWCLQNNEHHPSLVRKKLRKSRARVFRAAVEAEVASFSNSRKRKLEVPAMSLNDKTEALRQQLGLVGNIPSVARQASAMFGVPTTEDTNLVEKIEACYALVFGA